MVAQPAGISTALYARRGTSPANGKVSDSQQRGSAFTICLGSSGKGTSDFINRYQLVINSRPVRTIGSGLIQPETLPGCGLPHELQLLRRAQAAGMNFLRINGGGGGAPLPESWYDLADELGIMISHEFPIGNCSPETDPVFLANLEGDRAEHAQAISESSLDHRICRRQWDQLEFHDAGILPCS